MAKLKPYQVAAAAYLGGFPANEIPTAVAVAKGESSYNTTARNSCCSGLWQIHRTAHADKIRAAGGVDALKNPVTNAKIAYQIWKDAGGWCTRGRVGQCNPWQAYGVSNATGTWKAKMTEGANAYRELQQRQRAGESIQAIAGPGDLLDKLPGLEDLPGFGGEGGGALGGFMDAAAAIAGFAQAFVDFGNKLAGWIADPKSWMRVGQVVGGGFLVVLGLRIAFHKQVMDVGKEVVKWVKPGGKASRVAKGKV